MYETIGLLSIVGYVYPKMHVFSVEYDGIALRNPPSDTKLIYFVGIIHFITTFIFIVLHWIRNTIVHISLCQSKIQAVSTFEEEGILNVKVQKSDFAYFPHAETINNEIR